MMCTTEIDPCQSSKSTSTSVTTPTKAKKKSKSVPQQQRNITSTKEELKQIADEKARKELPLKESKFKLLETLLEWVSLSLDSQSLTYDKDLLLLLMGA